MPPTLTPTTYGPVPYLLPTNARILQESDSISALDGDSQELMLIIDRLFALGYANGQRPYHWNTAISGNTIAQNLARTQTNLAKYSPITHYMGTLGIFDVIGGGGGGVGCGGACGDVCGGVCGVVCGVVCGGVQPMLTKIKN